MNRIKSHAVFQIPIEGYGWDWIKDGLHPDRPHPWWLVTANPEILLEARNNQAYATALKQADVRLVDGFGLWLVLRLFGQKTERMPGVELSERIVHEAADRGWRVGFFGGKDSVAAQAAGIMKKKYPALIVEAEAGGKVGYDGEQDASGDEATHRMTLFDPHVLLVAMGHPKQELWIVKHIQDFPNLKVIIGVGGTFDMWAGRLPRAPRFLRTIGLEWFWRLILEPGRIGRILRAVVVFPILFLRDRFRPPEPLSLGKRE
jgi:N-acetylglucosaminyldiphosphoundecaprenol N-acetyl-beta-D-mannosaminyltransferase